VGFLLLFGLLAALVPALIAVHEAGHYLAGLTAGIPGRDMRIVLLAFPQHVALRDGDAWVSPVRDIARYIEVSRRHFATRWAAFRYVAGGIVVETAFSAAACLIALWAGWQAAAFWVASMSLGLYLVNLLLMDLPRALAYRRAAGDTSGLWEIAPLPAVALTVLALSARVLLVLYAAGSL